MKSPSLHHHPEQSAPADARVRLSQAQASSGEARSAIARPGGTSGFTGRKRGANPRERAPFETRDSALLTGKVGWKSPSHLGMERAWGAGQEGVRGEELRRRERLAVGLAGRDLCVRFNGQLPQLNSLHSYQGGSRAVSQIGEVPFASTEFSQGCCTFLQTRVTFPTWAQPFNESLWPRR